VPQDRDAPGVAVRGASTVIGDWPAEGAAIEVAPLHVHHAAIYRRYESELLE
jgi:hypothetical protein